jgi:hypothetical protein
MSPCHYIEPQQYTQGAPEDDAFVIHRILKLSSLRRRNRGAVIGGAGYRIVATTMPGMTAADTF